MEEKLQWDLNKVSREISNSFFHDKNLGGMLRKRKVGVAQMIMKAYPDHDWNYLKEREGYRITPNQAGEIRALHNKGYNQRELSRMYKCDPVTVFNIVHCRAFKQQ